MNLVLNRLISLPTMTIGRLGNLYTLELPWNNGDNKVDESCILPGTYMAQLIESPHFARLVPRLQNVAGRDLIEMHPANWPQQLLGCIGIGTGLNSVIGKLGIENSTVAFNQLMNIIDGQPFELQINNLFT